MKWNDEVIDLNRLVQVTRGEEDRIKRYLNQFYELVPTRNKMLWEYANHSDRTMIRQTVHQMSPQLHFFGVRGINQSIERIETEYETLPMEDLLSEVRNLSERMLSSWREVREILENQFAIKLNGPDPTSDSTTV